MSRNILRALTCAKKNYARLRKSFIHFSRTYKTTCQWKSTLKKRRANVKDCQGILWKKRTAPESKNRNCEKSLS